MNTNDIILYEIPPGKAPISLRFEDETLWLIQKAMAELFQTTSQNMTLHLKNVFTNRELHEETTCKDFLQVQQEGKRTVEKNTKFYNLNAIVAMGYRVNSKQATPSRIRTTQTHRELSSKALRRTTNVWNKVNNSALITLTSYSRPYPEYPRFLKTVLPKNQRLVYAQQRL